MTELRRMRQHKLRILASLQAATTRSQLAQSELLMEIDCDLAEGGEVEDGPQYFDRRMGLARRDKGFIKGLAVGE